MTLCVSAVAEAVILMPWHPLVHFYQPSFLSCKPASTLHISQTSTCLPDLAYVWSLWAMLLILPALGFSGNLCIATHLLGFWYVHLPLSTKLLSNHPSPPRCSHSVIPASPSNYWGIISVPLLMCVCDPVTCESQHYLPGFPRENKNSLTTKTDAFYLFCLPSCLLHFCAQLSSASVQTTQGIPAWNSEEVSSILRQRRAVQGLGMD